MEKKTIYICLHYTFYSQKLYNYSPNKNKTKKHMNVKITY